MKTKTLCAALMLAATPFINGCGSKNANKETTTDNTAAAGAAAAAQNAKYEENHKKIDQLNHDYPNVPVEGRMLEKGENACYNELKQRYKDQLTQLKKDVEGTGAKLVSIMLFVQAGDKSSLSNKYGTPFIKATIDQLGIDCIDFGPIIAAQDVKVITQTPRDGHWSKVGAKMIADHIATLIKKYPDASSKVVYKDTERPETFGDLPPNDDEVQDGGKDLPYHIKANSQGIRMDHDLTFPKKKKRVVLIGDSGLYCPFLDNEFTIAYLLQQQFPEYEIYAVATVNWTTEDYLSLWNEKVKYTEPDLVILGANATDIEDLFFTNRNHCSRSGIPFYPSPVEEKYYHETYK